MHTKLAEVIRRKHLALKTEQSYCAWLRRYCQHIAVLPADMPSEQKLEHFLTALSKTHITASTQNQAFNAIIFKRWGINHWKRPWAIFTPRP